VVGLAGLFALYYSSSNLAVIAIALLGYLAIALLKPQSALALVAFAIPFIWYPKQVGTQQIQVTETLSYSLSRPWLFAV
jgi:hypothetical protein